MSLDIGWWDGGDKISLLNAGNVPNPKASCFFTLPGSCGGKCVSPYLSSVHDGFGHLVGHSGGWYYLFLL